MRFNVYTFVKIAFLILTGAALLLLSAVYERGTTELSRALVKDYGDVPEMIEHLIAGALVAVAGAWAIDFAAGRNT